MPGHKDIEDLVLAVRSNNVRKASAFLVREMDRHGHIVKRGWSGSLPGLVRNALKEDLVHMYGVPEERLQSGAIDPVRDGSRAGQLSLQKNEKTGASPVSLKRVFVKPQPGRAILMDGDKVFLPNGVNLSIELDHAAILTCPGVILVENEEVFNEFHRLDFAVPLCRRNDLLVFRGKPHVARQDTCEAFLRKMGVPVTVFPDMDPAGLALAMSTPGFAGILWPGRDHLAQKLLRLNREDLYAVQIGAARGRLDRADGPVREARDVIMAAGAGVTQEAFLEKRRLTTCEKSRNGAAAVVVSPERNTGNTRAGYIMSFQERARQQHSRDLHGSRSGSSHRTSRLFNVRAETAASSAS